MTAVRVADTLTDDMRVPAHAPRPTATGTPGQPTVTPPCATWTTAAAPPVTAGPARRAPTPVRAARAAGATVPGRVGRPSGPFPAAYGWERPESTTLCRAGS